MGTPFEQTSLRVAHMKVIIDETRLNLDRHWFRATDPYCHLCLAPSVLLVMIVKTKAVVETEDVVVASSCVVSRADAFKKRKSQER